MISGISNGKTFPLNIQVKKFSFTKPILLANTLQKPKPESPPKIIVRKGKDMPSFMKKNNLVFYSIKEPSRNNWGFNQFRTIFEYGIKNKSDENPIKITKMEMPYYYVLLKDEANNRIRLDGLKASRKWVSCNFYPKKKKVVIRRATFFVKDKNSNERKKVSFLFKKEITVK